MCSRPVVHLLHRPIVMESLSRVIAQRLTGTGPYVSRCGLATKRRCCLHTHTLLDRRLKRGGISKRLTAAAAGIADPSAVDALVSNAVDFVKVRDRSIERVRISQLHVAMSSPAMPSSKPSISSPKEKR